MKGAYQNTTDGIARMISIHMKNRFGDIGPINESMAEIMLKDTDSNSRGLEYYYENEVARMLEEFKRTVVKP